MARESAFQRSLKRKIKAMFPEAIILKTDGEPQGMTDLTVLLNKTWFSLECKASEKAPHRPNQDYYVEKCNDMSFARFVHPENEQEDLDELQKTFGVNR